MTRAIPQAFALATVCAVTACTGPSMPPEPTIGVEQPPITNGSAQPAVTAAFSLVRLGLAALAADGSLAFFVRPGATSILGSSGLPQNPQCNPASATATAVVPSYNATSFVQTTAIYPPGDSACAQAPEAVLVINYGPPSNAPQVGLGYIAIYSSSPFVFSYLGAGTGPSATSAVLPIYVNLAPDGPSTVNFSTNLSVGTLMTPVQPTAGPFPSSFPTAAIFPDQSGVLATSIDTSGLGLVAAGKNWYASTIGQTPLVAGWLPTIESANIGGAANAYTYGQSDQEAFSATTIAGGLTKISATAAAPEYAVSRSTDDFVTALSSFPLPAGDTRFTVGTATTLGEVAASSNFTTPVINTATYESDGTIVAAHVRYVDSLSHVSVDLSSTDGITFSMVATDLLTNAPLTNPSPLLLSPGGASCSFAYTPFETSPAKPLYTDNLPGYTCPPSPFNQNAKRRR